MLSKPLVLGALVLAALVVSGTGAYLGVRHNDADRRSAALNEERPVDAELLGQPVIVEETETVIEEPEQTTVAPAPIPEPEAVVARAEPVPPAVKIPEARPAESEPAEPVAPAPPVAPEPIPAPPPVEVDEAPAEAIDGSFAVEEIFDEIIDDDIGNAADVAPVFGPSPPDGGGPWRELEDPWPLEDDGVATDLLLEELVVAAESVIGLRVETRVSSEDAQVEDSVDARVTRDVLVGDRVAVPAGTRLRGSVVLVERGGRMSKEARIGVRFHTLVMADSTELRIVTETIYREGKARAAEAQRRSAEQRSAAPFSVPFSAAGAGPSLADRLARPVARPASSPAPATGRHCCQA